MSNKTVKLLFAECLYNFVGLEYIPNFLFSDILKFFYCIPG